MTGRRQARSPLLRYPITAETRGRTLAPLCHYLIQNPRLLRHRIQKPKIHLNRTSVLCYFDQEISDLGCNGNELRPFNTVFKESVVKDSVHDDCVAPLTITYR